MPTWAETKSKTHRAILDAWTATQDCLNAVDEIFDALHRHESGALSDAEAAGLIAEKHQFLGDQLTKAWAAVHDVGEWLTLAQVKTSIGRRRKSFLIDVDSGWATNNHQAYLETGYGVYYSLVRVVMGDGWQAQSQELPTLTASQIAKRLGVLVEFDELASKTVSRITALLEVEAFLAVELWEKSSRTDQDEEIDSGLKSSRKPPKSAGPFVPGPIQKQILAALDGKGLTKEELAEVVFKDRDAGGRLYRRDGLPELRERGLVDNKSGIGFYRTDSPPGGPKALPKADRRATKR